MERLTLVLGGAASGKSAFAEALVLNAGLAPVYIATAEAHDAEMAAKIALHRAGRAGQGWHTVEAPLDLGRALRAATADQVVLVDCATLWLTNHLLADHDLDAEARDLLDALAHAAAPVVVVSNEVGLGIVPDNALSRRFRAAQGALNRDIAAAADRVIAVMAGLPLTLKGRAP